MNATLLVLTVGTGTAGPTSDLVTGLRRTIELLAPRLYWLLPSVSSDSIATADLVREGMPGFQRWNADCLYRLIVQHDSFEHCREAVREVLAAARGKLKSGEKLLLNPTSGTKQMSAGATLAALDMGVGEIVFTVGERADGVVKTGTERIERFDASTYHAERDGRLAAELAASGSYRAAARILERHECFRERADLAACLSAWSNQDYERARTVAARSSNPALFEVRSVLTELAAATKPGAPPSELVAADLLQNANILLGQGAAASALFLACKSLEIGLRARLYKTTGLMEPYRISALGALPLSEELMRRAVAGGRGETCILNLQSVAKILESLNDPLAEALLEHSRLPALVNVRNQMAHGIRTVSKKEAREMIDCTTTLLSSHGALVEVAPRPPLPV